MTIGTREIEALRAIRGGADVTSYSLAVTLRCIERSNPELIHVCEPMTAAGVEADAYFGCTLTDAGDALVAESLR